ncbi:MAG: DUF4270 family protein [Bacteroidales bacterium]|nr:DUF4270 family protein [Bacteroidales bacterium]
MQFKDLFRHIAALSLGMSLAASCISVNKEVGKDFIPDDEKIYLKTVDIPVPLTLNTMSNVQGRNASKIIIGNLRSNEFGEINFSSAANIALSYEGLSFGKNAKLESIALTIPVSSTQYLNEDQTGLVENVNVYRTTKVLDSTYRYQNSLTTDDYESTPLNAAPALLLGDSLTVHLNKSLGEEILTATKSQLDSNSLFMERFKGLYVVSEPAVKPVNGGKITLFNLSDATVRMRINFTPTWESNLSAKDTTIFFKFGNGFCLNTSRPKSSVEDMAGRTDLERLPAEGLSGMKPYISAKELKETLDKWCAANNYNPKNIAVSKASFIFPFTPNATYDYTNYPSDLYPTTRDTAALAKYYYPVNDIYAESGRGTANKSLQQYSMDCSSTIQKYFMKDEAALVDDGLDLWFTAVTQETDYYGNVTYYTNLTSYYSCWINGPAGKNPPVLRLLYTVVK